MVRHSVRCADIDPIHVAVRALYRIAGIVGVASIYDRLLALLEDAMPAAIRTSIRAMMVWSRPARDLAGYDVV